LWKEISQYSTLFGRSHGALPSSLKSRRDLSRLSGGGTVIIEHIEYLSRSVQEKLADYMSDGSFSPLGDQATFSGRARIIATSSADLKRLLETGSVQVHRLYSMLSRQTSDGAAAEEQKKRHAADCGHTDRKKQRVIGKHICGIDEEAYQAIMAYDWPGNMIELDAVIRRAVHISRGEHLRAEDLFYRSSGVNGQDYL